MKRIEINITTGLDKSTIVNLLWDPEVALSIPYVVEKLVKLGNDRYILNNKYEVYRYVYPDDTVKYECYKNEKLLDTLSFEYRCGLFSKLCPVKLIFETKRLFPFKKLLQAEIVSTLNLIFKVTYNVKEIEEVRRILSFKIR
ncbi:hypothetical protein [Saccharolobus islandicus]|uniref:Plasmid pARN4 n=1 Tax=Saccharolobus islandicus (strain L.D.8.5 / Lassen \|nr:hypothetical protein [Sulfolobus islandicus]ADB88747.1 hypothetical protein LD85_3157 [Sulfolobus islandicus L.D.8.5]